MAASRTFPYFHPTTVVFIDDNTDFLQSLDLRLPPELAYVLCSSPTEALERINQPTVQPPLYARCFSHYRGNELSEPAERLIHLDLNLIEQEVNNRERFSEVAVVVVDYDMPAMNGLELIRQIADPHVQKILLTGVADERDAIAAFNDGLIDRFFVKNQPNAIEILNKAIVELQQAYYGRACEMLQRSLLLQAPGFLTDPVFAEFFARFLEEHRFVEYYLVENPTGFLLLRDDGSLNRMILATAADFDRLHAYAAAIGAPSAYLQQLANRDCIAYFFDAMDQYFEAEDWSDYFFPCQALAGTETWYYAVLEDPPVDIEFDAKQSNYRSYLNTLDT